MGVPLLYSFIRNQVPRGTSRIDLRREIRKYYSQSTDPNPPPPVIVVDLDGLVYPFCHLDPVGVLCGGRYNEIYRRMNKFFSEITSLGVQLEFFHPGPQRNLDVKAKCEKYNRSDHQLQKLFDAVDDGADVSSMMAKRPSLPFLYGSTLRQAAMNHGRFHWSTTAELDPEIVAFANRFQALAIMSNDSNFLIYEGTWRFWCLTEYLNLNALTMVECDRPRLVRALQLTPSEMPLLAALAGNKRFNRRWGSRQDEIRNVATFIREQRDQNVDDIFARLLRDPNEETLNGLQETLAFYEPNYDALSEPQIEDPIERAILSRRIPLFYQIWHWQFMILDLMAVDLRPGQEPGQDIPQLRLALMLRIAGIILNQRKKDSAFFECSVLGKLRHMDSHGVHKYPVEFPTHLEAPLIEELLSNDPVIREELRDIRLQLFCWIASDNIDHNRLTLIPEPLQVTVLTLYWLLEKRVLQLFEADLILQIVHDVTYCTYDPETVAYPRALGSRPFRVTFVFQNIYELMANAFNLVGLTDSTDEDPPFDGVLFHNCYGEWSDRSQIGDETHLDAIQIWRIYRSLGADPPGPLAG